MAIQPLRTVWLDISRLPNTFVSEPFGSLDVVSFPKAFGASKGLGALQKPSEDTRRSFSKFLRPKPTSPVLGEGLPLQCSGRSSRKLFQPEPSSCLGEGLPCARGGACRQALPWQITGVIWLCLGPYIFSNLKRKQIAGVGVSNQFLGVKPNWFAYLGINPIRKDSAGSVHELLARFERAKATQGPEAMPGKLVPPSVCGLILILWCTLAALWSNMAACY